MLLHGNLFVIQVFNCAVSSCGSVWSELPCVRACLPLSVMPVLVFLLCVNMCACDKFSFLHTNACNSNSTSVRAAPDAIWF